MRAVPRVGSVKATSLEDHTHTATYKTVQLSSADRTGFHRFIGHPLKELEHLFTFTAFILICWHFCAFPFEPLSYPIYLYV